MGARCPGEPSESVSSMAVDPVEHRNTTEARAGATPHVARVVLIVGTGLTILIFALLLLYFS